MPMTARPPASDRWWRGAVMLAVLAYSVWYWVKGQRKTISQQPILQRLEVAAPAGIKCDTAPLVRR